MKTALVTATITATLVLGVISPAAAIPDPDRRGSSSERVEVAFPFDAGSAPLLHVAGQDWLPARRAR